MATQETWKSIGNKLYITSMVVTRYSTIPHIPTLRYLQEYKFYKLLIYDQLQLQYIMNKFKTRRGIQTMSAISLCPPSFHPDPARNLQTGHVPCCRNQGSMQLA